MRFATTIAQVLFGRPKLVKWPKLFSINKICFNWICLVFEVKIRADTYDRADFNDFNNTRKGAEIDGFF